MTRKVDARLPGKGNSNSHGARPVHLMITMIQWIRTSRLSIKNSLSLGHDQKAHGDGLFGRHGRAAVRIRTLPFVPGHAPLDTRTRAVIYEHL